MDETIDKNNSTKNSGSGEIMKPLYKKLILALIIIATFILIRIFGLHTLLSFENLQNSKTVLLEYLVDHYLITVLIFILLYTVSVAFSIPGATILTLSAGFLFGTIMGALYANIGATIGAILIFIFARYLIGDKLQDKYADKLEKFNHELDKNGYSYMLTLRFIPLFPFWMINLFAGLTKIPLKTYAWTTAVGILPGSLVYTFMGNQLETINSPKDIISWNIILAFIILGLFALVPTIISHFKTKATDK